LLAATLSEIYTPCAGAVGMLLYINGKFTMGKLKSSLEGKNDTCVEFCRLFFVYLSLFAIVLLVLLLITALVTPLIYVHVCMGKDAVKKCRILDFRAGTLTNRENKNVKCNIYRCYFRNAMYFK
jgi:hypothetical protein